MPFLIISACALAFCLFSIAFMPVGARLDIKEKRLDMISQKKRPVFDELEQSIYKRFIAPEINKITGYIIKKRKRRNKKDKKTALSKNLRYAGIKITADEYTVLKNTLTMPILAGAVIAAFALKADSAVRFLFLMAGVVLWVLAPRYYLAARVKSRQQKIKRQLPEVLDLLCVSIEAGLGFDAALLKISEKTEGPLIDELLLLYREIQMGKNRREALISFSDCGNVPELKNFASAIIQADKLGIPIKNMLKSQAEKLRTVRRQKAEEKGMKSPIKMMLPMIVFILPVLFIILLGPVIIQVVAEFGK